MAISLSLMCGRVGSIFGSNIVGLFLDDYCESTFIFSGVTLLLSCILVFFIPNISYRETKKSIKTVKNNEGVA
jgi:predicted MFS family arabinose efflux permease